MLESGHFEFIEGLGDVYAIGDELKTIEVEMVNYRDKTGYLHIDFLKRKSPLR